MCDSVYYLHYARCVCVCLCTVYCVLDIVVVAGYCENKNGKNYNVFVKLCEILTDSECRQWTPNKNR